MAKNNSEILENYWILIGLEEALPFREASENDKKNVTESFGFQKYMLAVRLEELKKEIIAALPRFLRKLLTKKMSHDNL
ncbi:hypothetical protein ES705_26100 [subsurface metagenome]